MSSLEFKSELYFCRSSISWYVPLLFLCLGITQAVIKSVTPATAIFTSTLPFINIFDSLNCIAEMAWNSPRYLVFFYVYVLYIVVCPICFGHCVVCSSSICGFWLALWHFETLLLVEETGVPCEKHRPATIHWQTWSPNVISSTLHQHGLYFSFCHRIVCHSKIYGLWIPLWLFQNFLPINMKNM